MGINRIDIREDGGIRTLIDISNSTITEDSVVEGLIGYGADGEPLVGTNPYKKAETDNEVNTQEDLIEQILQELEGKASGGSGGITPSGTKEITENGQYDVTEFAGVNVTVPVGLFPSGTKEITQNGSHDVTEFESVNVNVPIGISIPTTITAGDTPVLFSSTMAHTCTSTTATATGISITVPRAGTYRFKFSCARTNTSGTWTAQLRKNGTAVSGATATWSSYQGSCTADVQCAANDKIEIYAQSRGSSYRLITGQLVACINWETGF